MIVKKYHSVDDFSAGEWDIFHKGAFWFSYSFLKVAEKSGVNGATYRYLTFTHEGMPKGAVVLSRFLLHLDLLSGNPLLIRLIKKIWPRAFQVPVVCCGIPVSFGQNHFCVLDDGFYNLILEEIIKALEEFGAEKKCSLFAWKEFEKEFPGSAKLTNTGYLRLPSLPDIQVNTEGDLPVFLSALRTQYRRKFKRTIRVIDKKEAGTEITVRPFQLSDVNLFYDGYMAVIRRTPVKLEIYPVEFFELLAESSLAAEILTISAGKESISALLICDAHALNFILVAKKKKDYQGALYTEMIRAIVVYGLDRGVASIRMGQTSYFAKMSAGGKPVALDIFIRSGNRFVQFVLRKCGHMLFPVIKIPDLNAFR